MKLLLVALLCAVAFGFLHADEHYQKNFVKFMTQFNKKYHVDAWHVKYNTFRENMDKIEQFKGTFTVGVNEFADLTWEEFKEQNIRGLNYRKRPFARSMTAPKNNVSLKDVPAAIDWRSKGAVNPVKDQAQCGSCWAFSAVNSLEGRCQIKSGTLYNLAEQELVDCAGAYGNQGCNGGLMDQAFEYVRDKKGLCLTGAYPYHAKDETCKATTCGAKYCAITGFADVKENSEDDLKVAVAAGPVSVAIEADQWAFQFYSGGIFDTSCGTSLDHGVAAVGYDHDAKTNKDYWIVRNSWGASWGDKGYIYMVRHAGTGKPGICGIAMEPSYPTL